MKTIFSYQSFKVTLAIFLSFLSILVLSPHSSKSQVAVVGYTTKVVTDGPVEIEAVNPTNEIKVFDKKGIAMVIPDGWNEINPHESHYPFENSMFKINIANDKGDQVWVWREKVKMGMWIDEKTIAEDLTKFAPINQHVKMFSIKGDGPDVKLYVWKAYHIYNGKKDSFFVYAGYKPAPVFKPNIDNARIFGRSAGIDDADKTEADIIEMAKFLQTYDEPVGKGKKKRKKTAKTIDDELNELIANAVQKATANFHFTYLSADSDEKQAEYDGQKLKWNFQTYPGWAKDETKIQENEVKWMVPSLVNRNNPVNETVKLSTQHLLLLCRNGLAMISAETKALLWYHKIGYKDCNLAVGTKEFVIVYQEMNDAIILKALETFSGNELWTDTLTGEAPKDWLLDDRSGIIIAVQQNEKETIITGIDIINGNNNWNSTISNNAGLRTSPLPEMAGGNIILYNNGIIAISASDGKSVWENNNIKLDDRCPVPQIQGDTLLLLDKESNLRWLDVKTGGVIQNMKVNKSAQYTNIFPKQNRIYLRGKIEDKDESKSYFINAINNDGAKSLWIYYDTIITLSNIIESDKMVYASTWQGPIALDRNTGDLMFRTSVSEVGKTYPVSIRQYGDTIVYLGEMVIAGVNGSSGDVLYNKSFDPVSQTMNLDAIDPNCEELVNYLKFYGKVGLEGNTMAFGDAGYFFNLSSAAQNQATKLSALSSHERFLHSYYGESDYWVKSQMHYNQSIINSSFAKAYANVGMMINIVPRLSKQVAEMTRPERERYFRLLDDREKLMALYQTYEAGDYAFRKMGKKATIIHLPTGNIISQIDNYRSLGDIILNPQQNEFYYHELRTVPELEGVSENENEGTNAHAFYLVANQLK